MSSCSKNEDNPTNPLTLTCTQSQSLTLTDRNPAGVDYVIDCEFYMSAGTLTIEPGTTIQFRDGAGMNISDKAAIKAIGTADKPIRFTNAGSNQASWAGVYINSISAANEINNVIIEKAAAVYSYGTLNSIKAAITVENSSLSLSNTQIVDFGEAGLALLGGSRLLSFSNNSFKNGGGYPVLLYPDVMEGIDFSLNTFTNNKTNYIYYHNSTTYYNQANNLTTFNKAPIPYYMSQESAFSKSVDIAAGVQIVFGEDASMTVDGFGTILRINGTANDHVIMKGLKSQSAYWGGLLITTGSDKNAINYLDISDGGSLDFGWGPLRGNIKIAGQSQSNTTIQNSTFTRSGICDVVLHEAWSTKNLLITNSGSVNICRD